MIRRATLACSMSLSLLLAPMGVLAQTDCDGWAALGDPSPRYQQSLAFDSARQTVVMFGGNVGDSSAAFGNLDRATTETWEYTAGAWRFANIDGPSIRAGQAMAYDPVRRVTVLFGGIGPQGVYDTAVWEWNGTIWSQHPIPTGQGPTGRAFSAMAFDPISGTALLHGGGRVGSPTDELWSWNGVAWRSIAQSQPTPGPRYGAGMAYDPVRGAVVIHGGTNTGTATTLGWDGTRWTSIGSGGPVNMVSLAFDSQRQRLVGIGGTQGSTAFELTPAGTWTPALNSAFFGFGASIVAGPSRPLLVGVSSNTAPTIERFQSSWELVGNTLVPVPQKPGPAGPYQPSLAFDSDRDVAIAFGGVGDFGRPGTDPTATWELRGERWIRRDRPGNLAPNSRDGAAMAFDPTRHVTVLQGGEPVEPRTWEWDGRAWTNRGSLGGPSSFVSPAHLTGAFDPASGRVLVYQAGLVDAFDGSRWSPVQRSTSIDTSGTAAFAVDPLRAAIVACGGNSVAATFTAGRSGGWSTLIGTRQTGSWSPASIFDGARGGIVLFGGFSSPVSNTIFPSQTYFLGSTANAWVELPVHGPTGRKFHAMAYDSTAQRTLLLGGGNHTRTFRETWKLSRGPAEIARQPALASRPYLGRQIELFIIAKGGGALRYQWFKDGQPLGDADGRTGSQSDTLVIAGASPSDSGRYSVSVSNPCGAETSSEFPLTVRCPADINADGVTNPDDLADFITCFFATPPCGQAEFNDDGDLNADDLGDYITAYFASC